MPDDDWSIAELTRAFLDFRGEVRDQLKWLNRLLIGVLASAVLSSIVSSVFLVVTR